MQASQLQAIAQRSSRNLLNLLEEHEDEILKAIAQMEEEAQNQEADKIVVTLNHAIKLDLTRKSQSDSLTYSVRTKLETVHTLPDPDEPELPGLRDAINNLRDSLGEGESMSIESGGKAVEISKNTTLKRTKK